MDLKLLAIPVFVLTMWAEHAWLRRRGASSYERRDTRTNILLGLGSLVSGALYSLAGAGILVSAYEARLFTLSDSWLLSAAALVGVDLAYYWAHRMDHRVRLMWAAHVTHHSSERLNLSTAVRQSWTQPLVNRWFYVPLALLGLPPPLIGLHHGISALYQFFIHTEAVRRLGPLEWVLNTPSHHRVHHARNRAYLDKNLGGLFIVWDRLFGTFAEERDELPPAYGVTERVDSHNPFYLAFHEWLAVGRDVRRAKSLQQLRQALFGSRFVWAPAGARPSRRSSSDVPPAKLGVAAQAPRRGTSDT